MTYYHYLLYYCGRRVVHLFFCKQQKNKPTKKNSNNDTLYDTVVRIVSSANMFIIIHGTMYERPTVDWCAATRYHYTRVCCVVYRCIMTTSTLIYVHIIIYRVRRLVFTNYERRVTDPRPRHWPDHAGFFFIIDDFPIRYLILVEYKGMETMKTDKYMCIVYVKFKWIFYWNFVAEKAIRHKTRIDVIVKKYYNVANNYNDIKKDEDGITLVTHNT